MRASFELQFGALREVWRHARGREHCRGEPGSASTGGCAPVSARVERSSIVDGPGDSWSQRGTKVNGSHHDNSPLFKPTRIQIVTYPGSRLHLSIDVM